MPLDDDDGLGYWREALKGRAPVLAPDEIRQGFYRVRRKNGAWEPVRFMVEDDYWVCLRNDVAQPTSMIASLFQWACRNPVEQRAYFDAVAGMGWQDEPPAPIGHNLPDEADPLDRLSIEFEGEKEQVDEMLAKPVDSQAEADRLAIWADRIQDLHKAVKGEHAVEKRPILDAGKRVDQRWRPLMDTTEAYYKKAKGHLKPWLLELDRIENERVETAKRNAAMLRAKAQEMAEGAARGGLHDGTMEDAGAIVSDALAAEREAERRNPAAGRTGAKVKMVTRVSALIFDYDVALQAVKHEPEIEEGVQRIANAIARVKGVPPLAGTRRVENREPA